MTEPTATGLNALEAFLWRSRFLVIVAVLASLAMTLALMAVALADTGSLVAAAFQYFGAGPEGGAGDELRTRIIAHSVRAVDGFLLATVMFIFGIGLYDLFIRRIQQSRGSARYSRIMEIRNLDELKSKLGKVIVLILIVKLFENTLAMKVEDATDVLMMGGAVLLMAVALYVSHMEGGRSRSRERDEGAE